MFDPRRQAILLVGGDKTGEWVKWYATAIPKAERLYADYITQLGADGPTTTSWRGPRGGDRKCRLCAIGYARG